MSGKLLALIAAIVLLLGAAIFLLARPSPKPAVQSPAAYYQEHPNLPNPRNGSFEKSEEGTYGYQTPKAGLPNSSDQETGVSSTLGSGRAKSNGFERSGAGTYGYQTPKVNPPK